MQSALSFVQLWQLAGFLQHYCDTGSCCWETTYWTEFMGRKAIAAYRCTSRTQVAAGKDFLQRLLGMSCCSNPSLIAFACLVVICELHVLDHEALRLSLLSLARTHVSAAMRVAVLVADATTTHPYSAVAICLTDQPESTSKHRDVCSPRSAESTEDQHGGGSLRWGGDSIINASLKPNQAV